MTDRYLVTGGAGFIGSHVVDALLARACQVRVLDDLSMGRRENVAAGAELVKVDLADGKAVARALTGVDYVIHLAAVSSVSASIREPRRSHEINVEAMHGLLLAAREAGVRRVVLASSAAVYGDSLVLPKHEHFRPAPLSPYALHKLIAEQYASLYNRLYGLETVSLRFFNVFGPRQMPRSPYSGAVSVFTRALLEGEGPMIYGTGEQTRDLVYVTDVARGILMACASAAAADRVINIASGTRLSVNDLYSRLQRLTGRAVAATYAAPRHGEVRHSQADVSLARGLLGFEPRVSIDEGLTRTVEWYRADMGRALRA